MVYIGIDIGGTKCAASLGKTNGNGVIELVSRGPEHKTASDAPDGILGALNSDVKELIVQSAEKPSAIGISCGGPLDSKTGVVLSPHNLPGWDNIPVVGFFREATGLPVYLCNDANAGALAEWRMGAGKGTRNMIFLTFGTGMGAGLILGGRLYEGTNGMAGDVGHIRLASDGPAGYGKSGSFEGFCSGGGIARIAKRRVTEELQRGNIPNLCPTPDRIDGLTAMKIRIAAESGDPLATEIMAESGRMLGAGLSILIDILNPEVIVIGSLFSRAENLLRCEMEKVIEVEALEQSRGVCRILSCALTESVGDLSALTVADYYYRSEKDNEDKNG